MWIFLSDAMLSIVEDRDDPEMLRVRARAPSDIHRVFPSYHVSALVDSDYPYVATVERTHVMAAIKDRISKINYDNFKGSIPKRDRRRLSAYVAVWSAMWEFGEAVIPIKLWRKRNAWMKRQLNTILNKEGVI